MQRLILFVALAIGITLGYVDSRPTWDDTGVMAFAVLGTSFLLGALAPRRPWAIALAIGVWIPLLDIVMHGNYGSLIALVLAFVGAYVGSIVRRGMISGERHGRVRG